MVERTNEYGGKTTVLIDTGPDLRAQLLEAGVSSIDGVLYTHDHADHTHGIEDLRPVFIHQRRLIDVYLDETTSRSLHAKFGYCFASSSSREYPPFLRESRITAGQHVTIHGEGGAITALPLAHLHGGISSLGFRIGNGVYSPDLSGMSDEVARAITKVDLWIVDALRHKPHPSHFSLGDALAWIERLKPKQAILTHLHDELDYETTNALVPMNVRLAHDGLKIVVTETT